MKHPSSDRKTKKECDLNFIVDHSDNKIELDTIIDIIVNWIVGAIEEKEKNKILYNKHRKTEISS